VAESNVKLRVDARDAVSALNQTNNASKQLNQTLNTTSKRAGTATANIQRFGISFRSVVGPMVALTGALTLANRSLNTFGKRQADLKVLAAQLERIGAGGSKQLDELKAAADRLGDATLFSQDDFIQSFNILSSFRAIAVESFTEVSEVAADIAQVMGSDVKSATVQLAKALEDPKRGLTALSRSGITFNEAQTETIKKLVDSGKLLDAQSLILETIKGQYEGAGTAAGKGFAGALDLLSENAGDAAEALGKGLEPAATDAANALAAVFEQISKIPAPAGQAALQLGLITGGVIALNKAIVAFKATKLAALITAQIGLYKAFGAQIYLTAAAQGALNVALGIGKALMIGLPFLAVAGGIIGIADALNQAINGQKDFNKLLKDGTLEMLENELATKKASLALQERFILQGRGEGRQADVSRLNRLREQVSELEAALVKKRAEKPKPKTKPGGGDTVIDDEELKRLAQIAAASADRVRSLEQQTLLASALNDEEKRQFERQIEIADLLQNKDGLNKDQLKDQLEALTNLYEQEDATRAIIAANELRKKKDKEANDAAEAALKAQQAEAQRLNQLFGGIGQTISTGIVDGLMQAKSVSEALSNTLNNVARQMMQLGINTLLKTAFPGFAPFSNLLGFANGGRPPVGRPSVVGERGPELFVPDRAGTILPNGVGMGSTTITVNVDASETSADASSGQGAQLGKAIGLAVQQELLKQKRPGGLLAGV
jgi:hypothetical protein|tara:strand:+ start:195 stop:2360 length:2166 start_codon:yes stop_codon:yes gene_type:complete